MMAETNVKRMPSKRVLDAIDEGLAEIQDYFGWRSGSETASTNEKTGGSHATPVAVDQNDLDNGQDEELGEFEYDGELEEEYFDREEVEVALDAFTSSLLASGIIKKSRSGKAPGFGSVFGKFFGEHDEVAALASKFEDKIEGYMGWISPDDMMSAEKLFLQICDRVREMVKGKNHAR